MSAGYFSQEPGLFMLKGFLLGKSELNYASSSLSKYTVSIKMVLEVRLVGF